MFNAQRKSICSWLSGTPLRTILQVVVCAGITLLVVRQVAAQVLTAQLSSSKPRLGPSVVVPRILRDLGDVPRLSRPSVTFQVHNAGDERLILQEHSAGCACTRPDSAVVFVAPRETASISIPIEVGTLDSGEENYQMRSFETNDPSQPRVILVVRYRVRPAPAATSSQTVSR